MTTGDKFPVTSALSNLRGEFFTDNNLVSAGATIIALRITLSTSLALLAVALLMSVRALRHDDGVFDREVSPSSPPG